jgi:CDP-glycerol glycerophosphotransferase (TagB/SpsB family)
MKDSLDINFFLELEKFIIKNNYIQIVNVRKKKIENNINKKHPLDYQFKSSYKKRILEFSGEILCSIYGIVIKKQTITKINKNNLNIIDLNNFLLKYNKTYIGFLHTTYYIERFEKQTVNYIDELSSYLSEYNMLVNQSKINKFLEYQILYFTYEYIKQTLIYNISLNTDLPNEQIKKNLHSLMERVEIKTISLFKKAGFNLKYRMLILGYFKNYTPKINNIYINNYDSSKSLLQLNYFYYDQIPYEEILIDNNEVIPEYTKIRSYYFLNEIVLNERIIHVHIPNQANSLQFNLIGYKTALIFKNLKNSNVDLKSIIGQLSKQETAFNLSSRVYKFISSTSLVKTIYKDAWVLLDKDSGADDNAEHLYRYIKNHRPDINAFFLLDKKSKDWNRLKKENFKLIAFGSLQHKLLLLNAKHLLSSHAAPFVVSYLSPKYYKDRLNYKFTFLQHGVTKDNISRWMNSRKIDCFIATSQEEYNSIAGDYNTYKMSKKEVALTGFSRHDTLLKLNIKEENLIMIMPTWRLFLAGELTSKSGERSLNQEFYKSDFAKKWRSFLHSTKLFNLLEKHNFKIVFFPHPNIKPYLDWFDVPNYIEIIQNNDESIQSFFKKSKFMITDYSSVAFDMAYLGKPVLYYQFDHKDFFSGKHSYTKGYYDYTRDGFGPISYEEEDLINNIKKLLENNCIVEMQYLNNIKKAFLHRDGKNSQRIVKAVENLYKDKREQKNIVSEIYKKINITKKTKSFKKLNFLVSLLKEDEINDEIKLLYKIIKGSKNG